MPRSRGRRLCPQEFLCSLVILVLLCGCEVKTDARLRSGQPVSFELSGSGSVAVLTVFEPRYRTEASSPGDVHFATWRIEPVDGYMHGTRIYQLKTITYGVVPPGYRQTIPQNGERPAVITPGKPYLLDVETVDAPGFYRYFLVEGGQWKFVDIDGPCFQSDRQKPVPCPKTD